MKNGYHIYTYENGSKYEGEWKDNKRHGKGIFYDSDGSKHYEGYWKSNKKHLYGIAYWSNGNV
jgi:hypothetical protein